MTSWCLAKEIAKLYQLSGPALLFIPSKFNEKLLILNPILNPNIKSNIETNIEHNIEPDIQRNIQPNIQPNI